MRRESPNIWNQMIRFVLYWYSLMWDNSLSLHAVLDGRYRNLKSHINLPFLSQSATRLWHRSATTSSLHQHLGGGTITSLPELFEITSFRAAYP
ncbi:hypothetical protein VTO42DRAFT_88 [Malbranchea cinnamomea]